MSWQTDSWRPAIRLAGRKRTKRSALVRICKTGIWVQARGIFARLDASRSAPVSTMGGTRLFVGPTQQPRYHVCAFIRPEVITATEPIVCALPARQPGSRARTGGWTWEDNKRMSSPHRACRRDKNKPCESPLELWWGKAQEQEHMQGSAR